MRREIIKFATATVLCTSGLTWAASDLVVTDIELIPALPAVTTGLLRATINNIGQDGTGLPVLANIGVEFYRNGVICDTANILENLNAGESVTSESAFCSPDIAGTYDITVIVDSDSEVSESNEANNDRIEPFEWVEAGPVVIFDTDVALPAMPSGDGSGIPVCIDSSSGLLVAGCDGAVGPEGPEGPPGPDSSAEIKVELCNLFVATDTPPPSLCTSCGNGLIEPLEECDDGNVADGDGCSSICKNEEVCDGSDLTLTTECTVNYGDLYTCGGVMECQVTGWGPCILPEESCDDLDNDCDGAVDEDLSMGCYTGPTATRNVGECSDGVEVCTAGVWGACIGEVTPQAEICDDFKDNDCDGNTDLEDSDCVPLPTEGDVIFTELMPNPAVVVDNLGEWFEVLNVSGGEVSLEGCIIEDAAALNQHVIVGPLNMAAGEQLLFAVNGASGTNGGMSGVDYVYPSQVSMNNDGDSLNLSCDQALIDSVAYNSTWPYASGVSMQLDPRVTSYLVNDNPDTWCSGVDLYGDGDNAGTPGAGNQLCP